MTPWEIFFQEKIKKILTEKKVVIDIGGGLRARPERGNRYDPARAWILPYLAKVDYKILDPVSDYKPDIIGDIHHLPFADNSQEAIICLAVLEHVENPIRACEEIYRVLKPGGGMALVYAPFLYYYHAQAGYYKDYWRFTHDTIDLLFKKFSVVEKQSIRGAFATWLHLSPFGKIKPLVMLFNFLDRITHKIHSKQVSGYYVFLSK